MHFDYFAPASVEEAIALLSRFGKDAVALAGGTDVVIKMREKTLAPGYVVSLGRLPDCSYIRNDKDAIKIGALTTISAISESALLQEKCGIVTQAASVLADPSVRNVATIGGNLCNASPCSDMAPALIALSATASFLSHTGERVLPLEDFFTGPGTTVRERTELMTEIRVPLPAERTVGMYLKHSIRGAADIAIVSAAVVLTQDSAANRFTNARIVLGSAAPTPLRARVAEKLLQGKKPDDELIAAVARTAATESRTIDDVRSSSWYRKEMIEVLVAQAVRRIRDSA